MNCAARVCIVINTSLSSNSHTPARRDFASKLERRPASPRALPLRYPHQLDCGRAQGRGGALPMRGIEKAESSQSP